jgi:hypothetical protein
MLDCAKFLQKRFEAENYALINKGTSVARGKVFYCASTNNDYAEWALDAIID